MDFYVFAGWRWIFIDSEGTSWKIKFIFQPIHMRKEIIVSFASLSLSN